MKSPLCASVNSVCSPSLGRGIVTLWGELCAKMAVTLEDAFLIWLTLLLDVIFAELEKASLHRMRTVAFVHVHMNGQEGQLQWPITLSVYMWACECCIRLEEMWACPLTNKEGIAFLGSQVLWLSCGKSRKSRGGLQQSEKWTYPAEMYFTESLKWISLEWNMAISLYPNVYESNWRR